MRNGEENIHITEEQWIRFSQGKMTEAEEEKLYQHIGSCTYCAEEFSKIIEQDFSMEPPKYLEEEILERTKRVDVQAIVAAKKTSKKMQLLVYSLKVGFAVAASIFLLTMTTQVDQIQVMQQMPKRAETEMSITEKLNHGSNRFTSGLKEMTNGFLNWNSKEEEK